MKKTPILLLLVGLICTSIIEAQSITSTQRLDSKVFLNLESTTCLSQIKDAATEAPLITVEEYLVFLRANISKEDSDKLYSDALECQILRTSEGDNDDYVIAAGVNNDDLMLGLTLFEETSYLNWVKKGSLSENNEKMMTQSDSPLMMFGENEVENTPKGAADFSIITGRGSSRSGAAANNSIQIARGTPGPEMTERNTKPSAPMSSQPFLTLDHFRTALTKYPEASRFVIVEDEENENAVISVTIQPISQQNLLTQSRPGYWSWLCGCFSRNYEQLPSGFATAKNQDENRTIFHELHELLIRRHGVSSEIATSFFDGVSDVPLSAARLGEILRQSDAAQKLTSQKIPPASASENKVISPFDDSNVDEYLGADIRSSIYTTEKIKLAEDLSDKTDQAMTDFKKLQKDQKAAVRKKREQKIFPSALETDTEGYLTPGTFLKSAILKTAQAEVAASVLQGSTSLSENKKLSAAERNVEDLIRSAEEKRTEARKASLAAKMTKSKTEVGKANFDTANNVYTIAEEAWIETFHAYQAATEAATTAAVNSTLLINARDEAAANAAYWAANTVEVNTRKLEAPSSNVSSIEGTEAASLEEAWSTTIEAYKKAIEKANIAKMETIEWAADLKNAEDKRSIFEQKANEEVKTISEAMIQEGRQLRDESNKYRIHSETAKRAGRTDEASSWYNAGFQAHQSAEKLLTAVSATINRKPVIAKKWREISILEKQSIEFFIAAARARAASKTSEGYCWHNAGYSLIQCADKLSKGLVAELDKKSEEAKRWREAAEVQHQSIEYFTSAAKIRATQETKESDNLNLAGHAFNHAASKLEKAIEAQINGSGAEGKWRLMAQDHQRAIEPFIKAARAYSEEKINKGDTYNNIGLSFTSIAELVSKKIEAELEEKHEEAAKWKEAASQLLLGIESFNQAVRAYTEDKTNEGNSWNNAGTALKQGSKEQAKAIQIEKIRVPEVAQTYRKAAELYSYSASLYTMGARAHAEAKIKHADSWDLAGNYCAIAAKTSVEALEAGESGNLEEGRKFYKTSEEIKRALAPFFQSLAAYNEGEQFNGFALQMGGNASLRAMEQQAKAKIAEESQKLEIAKKYRDAAKLNERAVESYTAVVKIRPTEKILQGWFSPGARAIIEQKIEESSSWYNAGYHFISAAEQQIKEIEESEILKAEKYKRAVELSKRTAEVFVASGISRGEGQIQEGGSLYNAGQALTIALEQQAKAIEAEENGTVKIAEKCQHVVALSKRAAELSTTAAQAYVTEKEKAGNSWHNAGSLLLQAVYQRIQSIKAEESRALEAAQEYQRVAENYESIVEIFIESAKARALEKIEEGERLFEIAVSMISG